MSRYSDFTPVMSAYRGKLTRSVPLRANPSLVFAFTFHQVGETYERIDLLADTYYGDSYLWSTIADANPEILYWGDLATGTVIRVPNV